jgi:hypothetical protein
MAEHLTSPEFTPISPNPYVVGNPVRDPAMFFGREAEFELVRKRFEHATHGGLVVFCGERRSGKTSILFQIVEGRLGPDFIPVLIDMQSMAIGSEVEFLERIAREIIDALGPEGKLLAPPNFETGSKPSTAFQRFIEDLVRTHPKKKPIFLFDEYELFENKIESGTLTEDVLDILSGLMEKHSVFLIFTGSQHLEQRRREYWKILPKSIYRQISYLQREDAIKLITKPIEGRVAYEEGTVDAIYRLSAGQPFYTQAICQSLVDSLNDRRSRRATDEILRTVVEGIVENPFPQMIFLWDGLERDEKLVLALLAETLPNEVSYAQGRRMAARISQNNYPLDLDENRIASALETLFKKELLLKDNELPSGYSFRMDLWRLWIRRMHSVWQVMREEGIEIRPRRGGLLGAKRGVWILLLLGGLSFGLVVTFLARNYLGGRGDGAGGPGRTAGSTLATCGILTRPADALISLDGEAIGRGMFRGPIQAGEHTFRIEAAGYADTTFTVALARGDSLTKEIALRVLFGRVRIATEPGGAEVRVNGQPRGKSPVEVGRLGVAELHEVEAVLPGRQPVRAQVRVKPDTTVTVTLTLPVGTKSLYLTSEPIGAEILVDGQSRGRTPRQMDNLAFGRHGLRVRLDGFVETDTTIDFGEGTGPIHFALKPEPPGVLVLQGNNPAKMYIDGILAAENVPNSGPRELRPGRHTVEVILVSGEVIKTTIEVRSREKVTYDYTSRSETGRAPVGGR